MSAGTQDNAASGGDGFQAPDADHAMAGSWLVTYDVPAFGLPFPLLLSLADGGVAIETDSPGAFALGPGLSVVLEQWSWSVEPGARRQGVHVSLLAS